MNKHFFRIAVVMALLASSAGCIADDPPYQEPEHEHDTIIPPPPPEPCNGHTEFCTLRFNEICFPATHNSYNYDQGATNFLFPNQTYDIGKQLADGIRLLMIDVHDLSGELRVFHNYELLGTEPVGLPFGMIREFLESHPRDVVSIIFETEIDGTRMAAALDDAGLTPYIHTQSLTEPWPTLQEMIEANHRLVIFVEDETLAGTPAWYHYAWAYISDTDWNEGLRSDSLCSVYRGNAANSLFMINHWITTNVFGIDIGVGSPDSAAVINAYDVLGTRAWNCRAYRERIPNFIAVDYYNFGELFQVVDEMNGL